MSYSFPFEHTNYAYDFMHCKDSKFVAVRLYIYFIPEKIFRSTMKNLDE
jgi:hypothetical protein